MFVPEYRTLCAAYFAEYLKQEYKSDELLDGWESHVTADAVNFNKFSIGKIYYILFRSGTIHRCVKGTLAVKSIKI